ncbi:MAG TPA: flagellar biosynthesis anti-sigma factor FlgM [candidate division Zixibacteria bacterium]|nr:flagellar biosynthesis anti-sigma factor FlgM [candidate division Zixibacteria bacterium]
MRIDNNTFATIGALQNDSPAQRGAATQLSHEDADGVTAQLSCESKTLCSAGFANDIRQDRVAALKQAIDNGTYEVNASGIAGAMMDSMINARFTL